MVVLSEFMGVDGGTSVGVGMRRRDSPAGKGVRSLGLLESRP
jgi:hypothetical protein